MEPMRIKSDSLRRQLPDAMEHIIRGGTVEVYRYDRLKAVMLPPPPNGMKYELVTDEGDKVETLTLSIVRGEQPFAAETPYEASEIKFPDEIYAWFAANGVSDDDPDVWVHVEAATETKGELFNVVAQRDVTL